MIADIKSWIVNKCRIASGFYELRDAIAQPDRTLVLDYPPSRDLRPRWGYGVHRRHAELSRLFATWESEYLQVLDEMRDMADFFAAIPADLSHGGSEPGWIGPPMNAVDSALLCYFLYAHRPRTYLEIGSGYTTLFASRTIRRYHLKTQIISVDPQPRANVDAVCDKVIRCGLEEMDLSQVANLEPGDIVFMDGSHRSFMNSDVTVFMLDVLPKLAPGVIVHFHDIVLPADYPEMFIGKYWNEQYLVAAYLLGSGPQRVRVLMPSFYVSTHARLRPKVEELFRPLGGNSDAWFLGGSLWFTHQPA